jgi:trk system potassium uptake protein
MNYSIVRFVMGRIMLVEALLLVPSLAVGLIYREGIETIGAFLLSIMILVVLGFSMSFRKPAKTALYAREGFVIVALTWFLLSLFGSLPFIISGSINSFVDAFFETASGFTTTGASILSNIEVLPHSILFWRSFTHLIGGMGVLVFTLAILPKIGSNAIHIMKAEVPGPTFGKLLSKVSRTARILYIIYLCITAGVFILLVLGKMPVFDSFIHAFGAAGTGGFSNKNASIAAYNSIYIDYVLSFAMLMFGVNFNLYFLLIMRKFKPVFRSEELRWYFGLIAAAMLLICFFVWPDYDSVTRMVRDVFFTVSSIITTTGFATVDFDKWPLPAHIVLLFLMFCGAMAGSTGGGIKTTRVAVYIKTFIKEVRHSISPNRRLPVMMEGKTLDSNIHKSISRYFIVYVLVFCIVMFIISIDSKNFTTAFSAVAATFNNIGPGLDAVGPVMNYSQYSDLSKITLIFAMIAGRLEIIPVLILFSPRTWRKV